MSDINARAREAFASYRGIGRNLIDEMVDEIERLHALNAELLAALQKIEDGRGILDAKTVAHAAIAKAEGK